MTKRILFLSQVDYAAIASRLTEAINEHTDWEAMSVVDGLTPGGKYIQSIQDEKSTYLYENNVEKVTEFLKLADVIIWGNHPAWNPVDVEHIREDAIKGIWWTGSNYRTRNPSLIRRYNKKMDLIFTHRDLENFDPRAIRLGQPFNCDLCTPDQTDDKILIGHSPSQPDKLWKKGSFHFFNAMRKMEIRYRDRIEVVLMKSMEPGEVLLKKCKLHIFFDQIGGYYMPRHGVHGYGMSLVEAASAGAVCLCWSDYKDTPIIHVENGADIEMAIEHLMDNPDELERLGKETREWALATHDQFNVAKRFVSILDIYYNRKHPRFKAIEKVVHGSGSPNNLPGDVLWVRDIPHIEDNHIYKLKPNKQKIVDKAKGFICVGTETRCAIAQARFINRNIPYKTFPNYQNYRHTSDDKRDEIVYVDNSSSNCSNYKKIVGILQSIHEQTNLDVVFCCRERFLNNLKVLVVGTDITPMCRDDYDYNGRYGIFVEAFTNPRCIVSDDYITGYYRKFWLYLACGIIPIIISKCKDMVEFCEVNDINHITYNDHYDIGIDDKMYCNWNKFEYTFEFNFPKLEQIINDLSQ